MESWPRSQEISSISRGSYASAVAAVRLKREMPVKDRDHVQRSASKEQSNAPIICSSANSSLMRARPFQGFFVFFEEAAALDESATFSGARLMTSQKVI